MAVGRGGDQTHKPKEGTPHPDWSARLALGSVLLYGWYYAVGTGWHGGWFASVPYGLWQANAKQAIALKSCKWINIKPGRVGGVTVAKQIHDYAQARGVPCWIGGMLASSVGVRHHAPAG